jgi:hypothetical protein
MSTPTLAQSRVAGSDPAVTRNLFPPTRRLSAVCPTRSRNGPYVESYCRRFASVAVSVMSLIATTST